MKENEKKMELATVEIDNDIFAVKEENTGDVVRYSTTYDDVDLFNAVNGGSEPLKNYLGKDVVISDIIITSADVHENKEDENSPIVSKACVHFYGENGLHIASLSNGIIRSAKTLIQCGFAPSKDRPVTLRFKTTETKKGTAHTFDLISR